MYNRSVLRLCSLAAASRQPPPCMRSLLLGRHHAPGLGTGAELATRTLYTHSPTPIIFTSVRLSFRHM